MLPTPHRFIEIKKFNGKPSVGSAAIVGLSTTPNNGYSCRYILTYLSRRCDFLSLRLHSVEKINFEAFADKVGECDLPEIQAYTCRYKFD